MKMDQHLFNDAAQATIDNVRSNLRCLDEREREGDLNAAELRDLRAVRKALLKRVDEVEYMLTGEGPCHT